MFHQRELELIMKTFDIDLESAKYYQKHGDLPERILRERITSYIDQYVENPQCEIPVGISVEFAHYLQLYIDQYPNLFEDLKKIEVPPFISTLMEEVLTDQRLLKYREKRYVEVSKYADYKSIITKILTDEMRKNDFSIAKIIPIFEEKLKEGESYKTVAILSVLYDLLRGFFKKDILQKDDFELVETLFLKYQHQILYYPDLDRLTKSNQGYKDHYSFLEKMDELSGSLEKLDELYEKHVKEAPYQKKMDGITFTSKSRGGLERLLSYYKDFKESSQSVNQKHFLYTISHNDLYITDIHPPKIWDLEDRGPCFMKNTNIIYLDQRALDQYFGGVLYHEAEHFNYSLLKKQGNHSVEEEVMEVLKSLREKVTKEDNKRFLMDYQEELKQWRDYLEPYKEEALEVFREDLLNEGNYPSDELLEERYSQYTYEFANTKLYQSGYNSMFDIFDAIHKGEFSNAFPDYKVGHKDSFSRDDICCNEIMAEISILYNYGNIDMLVEYLPYEEVKKLIHIYEKTIHIDQFRDSLLADYKETMKDEVDYHIHYIDHLRENDLAALTSYEVAGHYLEQAMKEYGEKEFVDLLIEYQMTGNLDLFQDEKIRKYISLLDDSHISMFLQGNLTEEESPKNK